MVIPKKILLLTALLCTGLLLAMTPFAGAAINTGAPSYDQLMQAEIDSLLDQLAGKFENTANYLEESEFYTIFSKGLAGQGAIKQYYDNAIETQKQADANKDNPELQEKGLIAMDELFLSILYQVQLNKALATKDIEITKDLIDILEGRLEGFSEEPGPGIAELGTREGNERLPDPRRDPDPDPDPEVGFLFYGKAYNLDTDIDLSKSTNGILYFTDDPFKVTISDIGGDSLPTVTLSYPAAAMPFLFHELPYPDLESNGIDGILGYLEKVYNQGGFIVTFVRDGEEVSSEDFEDINDFINVLTEGSEPESVAIEYIPQDIFEAPVVTKNQDFYRYTWDTLFEDDQDDFETGDYISLSDGPEKIPPFSTTLYKNNWISYVYGDLSNELNNSEMPMHMIFTGLTPGDGSAGQPGEGLPRGLVARLGEMYGFGKPLNLSEETGSAFFNTEDDYMDFLIQLGGDAPSDLSDYITIINEDGWEIKLFGDGEDVDTGVKPKEGEAYLTIGEAFIYLGRITEGEAREFLSDGEGDGLGFDLSEQFVVFIPDASEGFSEPDQGIGNQYRVETGNPHMIVDRSRHNYDDGYSSLDEAIVHIADNPTTLNDNDFTPDNYKNGLGDGDDDGFTFDTEYGLQTVGNNGNTTPGDTINKLNNSNFLAYVVQVEEDRVNEKILAMTNRADWNALKNGIRDYKNIRNRDAWFEQNADAKAGRVMKDIHGNWVRVQQYILRDNNSVKILNVSLREAGSNLSGMSTIDFTTNFASNISGVNIQSLPWGGYLTTRIDAMDRKFIRYDYRDVPYQIDSMSVTFTNPGNEFVSESRDFGAGVNDFWNENRMVQHVSSETLSLQGNLGAGTYTNTFGNSASYEYISHFVGTRFNGGYFASSDGDFDVPVFDDTTGEQIGGDIKILDVAIHSVGDTVDAIDPDSGLPEQSEYALLWGTPDIWAVLGAGQGGGTLSVDPDRSIEIIMKKEGVFTKPIDTIFIPMSHMMWVNNPT